MRNWWSLWNKETDLKAHTITRYSIGDISLIGTALKLVEFIGYESNGKTSEDLWPFFCKWKSATHSSMYSVDGMNLSDWTVQPYTEISSVTY